jgi:sterol desaturase/sphingolipid hydroxylase (fatty acid hydroxylase superfamily)
MIGEAIFAAIAAVLLAIRMTRQRAFRVNRLWIMPTAVLIVVAIGLSRTPVSSVGLAAMAAGLAAGAVLGFWRAKAALDRVDVAARSIMTKPSLVFALVFAATFALKAVIRHGPAASFQEATDFVLCLTAASICAQRLQLYRMFLRAEATG